jgi:hypothetical protein
MLKIFRFTCPMKPEPRDGRMSFPVFETVYVRADNEVNARNIAMEFVREHEKTNRSVDKPMGEFARCHVFECEGPVGVLLDVW